MTTPADLYDEPGSRTRLAWLRTGLVVLAVTLLVVRGLYLRDSPAWVILAAVGLAAAFAVLAVRRVARLGPHESPGVSRATVVGVMGIVAAGVVLAVVSLSAG